MAEKKDSKMETKKDKAQDQTPDVEAGINKFNKAVDDGINKLHTVLSGILKKVAEAGETAQEDAIRIDEVGIGKPIEKIAEQDMVPLSSIEKFMNDKLLINVAQDVTPGSLPVIVVTVNGKNQAIIRGMDQPVKRKYVEALARSKVTTFIQRTPDASQPENIEMVPNTALTYPFTVLRDPHKHGYAWLQAILAQR